jgi:hypothetical protein
MSRPGRRLVCRGAPESETRLTLYRIDHVGGPSVPVTEGNDYLHEAVVGQVSGDNRVALRESLSATLTVHVP